MIEFINPLFTKTNVLFIVDWCDRCAIAKKVCMGLNPLLNPEHQIRIIDCSNTDKFRMHDQTLIKIFSNYFDGYPTLFIRGRKKEGANTEFEYKEWLVERMRLSGGFLFSNIIN